MEDDGIGNETTAQAAAFFDVALESPRVSQGTSAGAAAPRDGNGGASSAVGVGSTVTGGRRSTTSMKDDPETRRSSAAEVWMYGGTEGPME